MYVDKTDLVWRLVNQGNKFNYLSRPRRFGKSVLVDTLRCYLEGRKELFEGLKIMELEKEWTAYPVIRLDMSLGGATAEELRSYLNAIFIEYEEKYNVKVIPGSSLNNRLGDIIETACKKTGRDVAVLIDYYDDPLRQAWNTPHYEECVEIYRRVFPVLKSDDLYEKFVFIISETKFTQLSLFSGLNNLSIISLNPECATLCGFTQQELVDNFQPEIQQLADKNGWTLDETYAQLKEYYGGYHFSRRNMTDIYNPYSLISSLADGKIEGYWDASETISTLPRFISDLSEERVSYFDNCLIDDDTLFASDVTVGCAELYLYQSGYLTIKGYEDGIYDLGFPNKEMRQAFHEVVLPALTGR